jgi:DNA-binding NarL/FixJ family response regulator
VIRVLVADDHTIVRQGVVSLLQASGDCTIVAEASDGIEAVDKAVATQPDVAVLDIGMPRLSGLEAVRRIREEAPRVRILVLTMHEEEEYVVHIVRAGASGYLVKDNSSAELLAAVRALARGQGYFGPDAARVLAERFQRPEDAPNPYGALTAREREVFHLVVEGKTTKEVAHALGISPKTAENHRTRLMEKLAVHNTAELVLYAAKRGLLP